LEGAARSAPGRRRRPRAGALPSGRQSPPARHLLPAPCGTSILYRRRPGGELGGSRAASFPAPRRLHHRRLGRSERKRLRRLMMESPTPAGRVAPAVLDPRRWQALALLGGAVFMVLLDGTITILALPPLPAR